MEVIKCTNDRLFSFKIILIRYYAWFLILASQQPFMCTPPPYRRENGDIEKASDLAQSYANTGKAMVQKSMLLISVLQLDHHCSLLNSF